MKQSLIFLLSIFLWGCSVPGVGSVNLEKKVRLTVSAISPGGKFVLFESGAEVRILKNKKELAISRIETINKVDNQCVFEPLTEGPPYQFEVKNAKIKKFQETKIVPIETQGGLVTPGSPLILNPQNDLVDLAKQPLEEGEQVSFSGDIEQSLTEPGAFRLPEIILDVLDNKSIK